VVPGSKRTPHSSTEIDKIMYWVLIIMVYNPFLGYPEMVTHKFRNQSACIIASKLSFPEENGIHKRIEAGCYKVKPH
jgi:hypothetical protein